MTALPDNQKPDKCRCVTLSPDNIVSLGCQAHDPLNFPKPDTTLRDMTPEQMAGYAKRLVEEIEEYRDIAKKASAEVRAIIEGGGNGKDL